MKKLSLISKTYSIASKAMLMIVLAMLISNCAGNKKVGGALKIKTKPNIAREQNLQSPNVRIEKDLVERDFQGKLRSTLSGYPFNTTIWSSNCDCR